MLAVATQSMHNINFSKIADMMTAARSRMKPGDIRIETKCPVCGGTAWVLRKEPYEFTRYIVASCEYKCFQCLE